MLIVLLRAEGMFQRNCYMACCRKTAEEATYFGGQRTKQTQSRNVKIILGSSQLNLIKSNKNR